MIADTKAQLSDLKLGKKLFQFLSYEIKKNSTKNSKKKFEFDYWVNPRIFFKIIFLHIMTRLYL